MNEEKNPDRRISGGNKCNPKASIVIPTYKDHEGLNRVLESVIGQTYDNLEIIVVNDYPKEDIKEFIDFSGDRIQVVNCEVNHGGAGEGARNVGIEESSGEFLFFVDGDDMIEEDTIEKLLNKYKGSDFEVVTCWGQEMEGGDLMKIPKNEGDLQQRSLEVCVFIPPGPLVKKKDLLEIGKYDENLRIGDRELAMRLAKKFKIGVVKEPLYIYDAKETEGMKEIRVKRLESQEYLLNKHAEIEETPKAYSNITQRMGLGHMLGGNIEESRYYFKESLDSSFSFGTLAIYLATFMPKFCRNLVFKIIEENKNKLKEMGF